MRVALLTPADWDPQYYELDKTVDILASTGIDAVPVVWNAVDDLFLDSVEGMLPLIAWGYHLEPDRWFGLLDRIERRGLAVANPLEVLRWSSDKLYLLELAQRGVAVVPTLAGRGESGDRLLDRARASFGNGDLIVKPVVSASAAGTHRLAAGESLPADLCGQALLVQPFIPEILSDGEISLVYFGGRYSHAAVKRPKTGDFRVQPEFGGSELPCDPPPSVLALAEQALAAAPGKTAYARIDIVNDAGIPRIMELELIEPDLFLRYAPDGGAAFAGAVRSMLDSA